jgi:excisionase family DNA binding protein
MAPAQRRVVGTREIAAALDCDPRTIIKAAREGKIPALRIGKEYRFDPGAVRLALSNNAKGQK